MNIVNITLGVDTQPCSSITLGRRGENEVTQVVVDFSSWVEEFGAGVITLLAMRSQDTSAYPVVLTLDGNTATWDVTSTDTAYKGSGRAEYIYTVGEQIAKSVVFNTVVMQDIGKPSETPPDPYEEWLERLTELGAETQANAEAAQQSAEDAEQSAQEAAQEAASAEGYAGQAETAAGLAQTAQTASEAARDAAQTAQASAESSATAASGSAASAAGSASDASASASAAGASATTASTAAGQAEAAKTAAQTAQSAAEDAAADAQQAAQQAHVEYEQLSGEVDDLSDEVTQQKSAIENLQALTNRKAGALIDTASGSIASFVPDSTIPNLLGVSVDIEPVQAGSGDPSPDNVRPISGWDSVEASNTSTNIWDEEWEVGGYAGANGQPWNTTDRIRSKAENYISVLPNTAYYFKTPQNTNVCFYDANKAHIVTRTFINEAFTTPANAYYMRFACQPIYGTTYNNDISINYPSTDHAYHPFAGNRYTIQLGDTIYGGTLDVTNGGCSNSLIKFAPTVYAAPNSSGYVLMIRGDFLPSENARIVCNVFNGRTGNIHYLDMNDGDIAWTNGNENPILRIKYTPWIGKTKEEVQAALDAMGFEVFSDTRQPTQIQTTPTEISAIPKQTNDVWSDAGDVSVTYAADVKTYIDSKIAAAVAALS